MAHQLKYYKEIDSHGHLWRVEILQETEETLTPTEIGQVLQGLRLVMQGDQADIDTPIVKTSLEMTFVDAPDLEDERKCGYWEEFYTSSATEYQVRLYKDGQIEWTGYVTPDSFSEDLRYRGSVSIIARDNLGALQDIDFEYEESNTVSLYFMLQRALAIGSIKMALSDDSATQARNTLDDSILSTTATSEFNCSLFDGKSWYEALEQALYATGTVLRYIGGNTLRLSCIRALPKLGKSYWWEVPIVDATFKAYGHRELSPAVKRISDSISYDLQDNIIDFYMPESAYTEETQLIDYRRIEYENTSENIWQETVRIEQAPVYGYVSNKWGGQVSAAGSLLLNPYKYPYKEGHYTPDKGGDIKASDMLLVACNQGGTITEDSRCVQYISRLNAGKAEIEMEFGWPVTLYDNRTKVGDYESTAFVTDGVTHSRFSVHSLYITCRWIGVSGTELVLVDGAWKERYTPYVSRIELTQILSDNTYTSVLTLPAITTSEVGELNINFYGTQCSGGYTDGSTSGIYIRWRDLRVTDASGDSQLKKRTINTNYSEKNNIVLDRQPAAAVYTGHFLSPENIRNGLFQYSQGMYHGHDYWRFNDTDDAQPLSVLIHQQLLAYYSKPNNVLTGELATPNPLFNALYEWQGKKHILTSGALNILTGRMENAVLREFKRYDHMWETWVENEDIDMDYPAGRLTFVVHTNKDLDQGAWQDFPSWISPVGHSKEEGDIYLFDCDIMENASGQTRSAIFKIDTAYVRVTQRAAGDYGIDYGKDYS